LPAAAALPRAGVGLAYAVGQSARRVPSRAYDLRRAGAYQLALELGQAAIVTASMTLSRSRVEARQPVQSRVRAGRSPWPARRGRSWPRGCTKKPFEIALSKSQQNAPFWVHDQPLEK